MTYYLRPADSASRNLKTARSDLGIDKRRVSLHRKMNMTLEIRLDVKIQWLTSYGHPPG